MITRKLMSDPVKAHGVTYERAAIQKWLREQGHVCPLTHKPLAAAQLRPHAQLREEIAAWNIRNTRMLSPAAVGGDGGGAGSSSAAGCGLYDF